VRRKNDEKKGKRRLWGKMKLKGKREGYGYNQRPKSRLAAGYEGVGKPRQQGNGETPQEISAVAGGRGGPIIGVRRRVGEDPSEHNQLSR